MQSCNHNIRFSLKLSDQLGERYLLQMLVCMASTAVKGLRCQIISKHRDKNHVVAVVRSPTESDIEVSEWNLSALTTKNFLLVK